MEVAQAFRVARAAGPAEAWPGAVDEASAPLQGGRVWQLRRRGPGCLGYVLEADGEALAVDPPRRLGPVLGLLARRGLRLRHALDTHLHSDHASGAAALAGRTGARLLLPAGEGYDRGLGHRALHEGDGLAVGRAHRVELEAVPMPGCTPGALGLRIGDDALLAGDALGLDAGPLPDAGEDAPALARQAWRTCQRLGAWPAGMAVLPGHTRPAGLRPGEVATRPLGRVRLEVDAFHLGMAEFADAALRGRGEAPLHEVLLRELNRRGMPLDEDDAERVEAGWPDLTRGPR